MLPFLLIQGKSPPMARWATSRWMSAQAQAQNPSGMLSALLVYSVPTLNRPHSGVTVPAASSLKMGPGFSMAATVIFTSLTNLSPGHHWGRPYIRGAEMAYMGRPSLQRRLNPYYAPSPRPTHGDVTAQAVPVVEPGRPGQGQGGAGRLQAKRQAAPHGGLRPLQGRQAGAYGCLGHPCSPPPRGQGRPHPEG